MPVFADPWNRAASWLAAWDSQGNHRTATDGDNAGAEWLAAEAAALGADVAIEEFAVERLDPGTAFLDIDGERIPAIPAFDAPATDRDGIEGRLGPVGGDAEIAVAELPPQAVYSGEYERLRRERRRIAALSSCAPGRVRACHCSTPRSFASRSACRRSICRARRAMSCSRPRRERRPARLVSESRRTTAAARNIVVSLDAAGRDRAAAPLSS